MKQRHFDEELDQLKARLVLMANRAESAVQQAVEALLERDMEKARSVAAADDEIDSLELEIDERVVQLLALQAPVARDLRLITMALKMSNDLERVGDHAVNIAQIVEYLVDSSPMPAPPEIREMVRLASAMLNDALDAFVRRDNTLARDIGHRDDRVDELHESNFRILLTHMMEDPRKIGPGMDLLLVSRNLERIADLATNIAEDVVYMVEGRTIKHHAEEQGPAPA